MGATTRTLGIGAVAALLLAAGVAGADHVTAYAVLEDVDVSGRRVTVAGRGCEVSASSVLRGLQGERIALGELAVARSRASDKVRYEAVLSRRGCTLYELQLLEEIPE